MDAQKVVLPERPPITGRLANLDMPDNSTGTTIRTAINSSTECCQVVQASYTDNLTYEV